MGGSAAGPPSREMLDGLGQNPYLCAKFQGMKYSTIYPVTSAQINAQYRLTVDGLLNFHENTIARYLTTFNLAAFDLHRQDKTWVISEINLSLPEPPTMWSEDVGMTVWISEMSSLRVWFDFMAKEVHSGKVTARGNSGWSLISMSERKLIPCGGLIPEGELVEELSFGPHRKRTPMRMSPDAIRTLEHTVNLIDSDFNGHMNNRRYVQMALTCFEPQFLSDYRPDNLNIRFLRESVVGEELVCGTHGTDDPSTFIGSITKGEGVEVSRICSHWIRKEFVPDIAEVNLVRN